MPSEEIHIVLKKKHIAYLLLLLLVPAIIYVYFLNWKTSAMHDDDLIFYRAFEEVRNAAAANNASILFGQFRPVRDNFFYAMVQLLPNSTDVYYLLNVFIHSVNTIIFAALLYLFLKSWLLSFFFSLVLALSRFSYYNMLMFFNGGMLEGIAMTFFLLFLYFMVRGFWVDAAPARQQYKDLQWSILFANISMYTHERYMVVFPFIALAVLLLPSLQQLTRRQKWSLSGLALGSLFLNFLIKKYVYSLAFFTGTGGTETQFSLATATESLYKAVCALFQVSLGPEYLVGLEIDDLTLIHKIMVGLIVCIILGVMGSFIYKTFRSRTWKEQKELQRISLLLALLVLFGFCLSPAIFQIRMELRWFQASFSVLLLMFVIAITGLNLKSSTLYRIAALVIVSFFATNYFYLHQGAGNLYYSTAARIGDTFFKAIRQGVIQPDKSRLYIWEKDRNPQRETEINWALVDGYFFKMYQNRNKKLVFVDSLYQVSDTITEYTLRDFDPVNDQIIYLDIQNRHERYYYSITDLTRHYLKDSLKRFYGENITMLTSPLTFRYNQNRLVISNDNFDRFSMNGFHENEGGVRWTDGNASIGLMGEFRISDSLNLVMDTYMPPICKDIKPRIFLIDEYDQQYSPVATNRTGDKFIYHYKFSQPTQLQKIKIISDTIPTPLDLRILSFPFRSMELRQ